MHTHTLSLSVSLFTFIHDFPLLSIYSLFSFVSVFFSHPSHSICLVRARSLARSLALSLSLSLSICLSLSLVLSVIAPPSLSLIVRCFVPIFVWLFSLSLSLSLSLSFSLLSLSLFQFCRNFSLSHSQSSLFGVFQLCLLVSASESFDLSELPLSLSRDTYIYM